MAEVEDDRVVQMIPHLNIAPKKLQIASASRCNSFVLNHLRATLGPFATHGYVVWFRRLL
jgi:hypothetical protein